MRLAALILASLPLAAGAATFRVDDTATFPFDTRMQMQWRSLAPTRAIGHAVDGNGVINVRLRTATWLNKPAKIYLALPSQAAGDVDAEWTTQGTLLPGQVRSGSRTLVFAGIVRAPIMEDTILLRVSADGRRLASPQRLEFHFEIDLD